MPHYVIPDPLEAIVIWGAIIFFGLHTVLAFETGKVPYRRTWTHGFKYFERSKNPVAYWIVLSLYIVVAAGLTLGMLQRAFAISA
jgi:hypothetical protein